MRPLKLTMTAFSCFAETTTIDFEKLNGLFLIDGETGAGKTTIFDAMTFALFGAPSGADREIRTLHTDFLPKSVDTVVRFEFLHLGKHYTVERRIHFPMARGTVDGYQRQVIKAVFTEEGKPPVEAGVNDRIEELLGLSAEQFKKVVMLPQGEFREFLKANSSEKNDILGQLFDNSEYVRFQNLLAAVRKALEEKRKDHSSRLKYLMETQFKMSEGDDAELYLSGHPDLLDNLTALVSRGEERLNELEAQLRAAEKAFEAKNSALTEAGFFNKLINELMRARNELAELEQRRDEMDMTRETYRTAEKAIRRVKPAADAAARAETALEKVRSETAEAEEALRSRLEERDHAAETVAADAPRKEQREKLQAEEQKLSELLPRYDELSACEEDAKSAKTEAETAAVSLSDAKKKKKELEDKLASMRGELKTLDGAGAEAERSGNLLKQAEKRRDALTAPWTGIEARMAAVLLDEEKLNKDEAKLRELIAAASEAEMGFHRLYREFLAGQSGVMADDMRRELEASGQAVCPVCNTVFRAGDAANFAEHIEGTPKQDEVDKARSAWERAEEVRRDRHTLIERRRAEVELIKQTLVKDVHELDSGCDSWKALNAPGHLEALHASLEAELSSALERCNNALSDERRAKALSGECERTEKTLTALAVEIEGLSVRESELAVRLKTLEAKAETIRAGLPYPDAVQAAERISALRAEIAEVSAELEAHNSALNSANERFAAAESVLKKLKDSLPGLSEAREEADTALTAALGENGFADIGEYRSALRPVGGADYESWLEKESEKLNDYDNAVRNALQSIAQLEKQTEGRKLADLDALNSALEESRSAKETASDAYSVQERLLGNHREVLSKASQLKAELAKTRGAFERIDRLAVLAVGSSGSGGKLSFDRFVMGTIFREVLEMANRRFVIMTDGRYELVHNLEAMRGNASAGLEIDVLDVTRGTRRPASSTFSGGEGFMASLALALGLSDVVQNRAGGMQLEALFVDEGFGTLDEGRLDSVINVLQGLTANKRLVGIISHVEKLDWVPQKLLIKSTAKGSTAELIND